jgi:hypothetical protein
MLDYWLFPLIVALCVMLWVFYLVVKRQGGPGVRTEGRTLVDKPDEENPPAE